MSTIYMFRCCSGGHWRAKVGSDLPLVLQILKDPALWEAPLFKKHIAARLGQRFTTERGDRFSYTLQEAGVLRWLTNYVPADAGQT
jgi:hypothetical protein